MTQNSRNSLDPTTNLEFPSPNPPALQSSPNTLPFSAYRKPILFRIATVSITSRTGKDVASSETETYDAYGPS